MMTSRKVRFLLSTYRMCGCRVARLQTSVGPQQKHLSKARQKAKEDRRPAESVSSSITKVPERPDKFPPEGNVFGEPPALYIAQYGRLIDTRYIRPPPLTPEEDEDRLTDLEKNTGIGEDARDTARRVKFVVDAVAGTSTFDKLVEALKVKPLPLFEPPVKTETATPANMSNMFTLDEEKVEKRSTAATVKIVRDDEAELLLWTDNKLDLRQLPSYYLMLSKSRLTLLVCITAAAGYGLAPGAFDPVTFALVTAGTGLVSCSANSVNQFLEVPFDSQMNRTKNRVLVRGLLDSTHAMTFAAVTGAGGVLLLYALVNPLTAELGALNLFLYTCVYTPMKRLSILNTWAGAVVGAIPPVMGWTACTGTLDPGCLIPFGVLFAWQFPHFNALSWNLRPDYSRAGYRMMSVTDPALCRRVALRYSVACIAVCSAAPALGVTHWIFALDSLPLNVYLTYLAYKFYRDADSKSSRKLFMYTLIHLPLLMTFMIIGKVSMKDTNAAAVAENVLEMAASTS